MKKTLAIILILTLAIAAAACGGQSKPAELDLSPSADLASDLDSYQVQLDGEVFTIPFPVQQILDSGWKTTHKLDEEIYGPLTHGSMAASKGNVMKGLIVLNNSETESMPASQLVIGNWESTARDVENGLSVVFPGGLTFGVSAEDVVAAYGEADDTTLFADGTVRQLDYKGETNQYGESSYWWFFFDEETGALNDVRVKRWTVD